MAPSPNMKLLEDGSLEISNIHPQDEGVYECAAMDTANNSPKIYHRLTVTVGPTIEFLLAKDNRTHVSILDFLSRFFLLDLMKFFLNILEILPNFFTNNERIKILISQTYMLFHYYSNQYTTYRYII